MADAAAMNVDAGDTTHVPLVCAGRPLVVGTTDPVRFGMCVPVVPHIEGRNLTITARYADGDAGRVLPLAD